jgi:adenosylcobinamide-GDP ribazoletransferase
MCWLLLPFGVALLVVLSAGLGAIAIGRMVLTRLGGQTGDVLGASSQLCECLALTVLAIA